jgi:hypothetical protein
MYIQRWGIFFIPHETKEDGTSINSAEVKPVGTKHIHTQVNNMTQSTTWSISMGNNIAKAGTDNTFVYTIPMYMEWAFVSIL